MKDLAPDIMRKMPGGVAIEDHAAVHYVDGEIFRVVSTKTSGAYRVSMREGKIIEHRLEGV